MIFFSSAHYLVRMLPEKVLMTDLVSVWKHSM